MPEWSKGSRLGRDTKVRGFKPHSAHYFFIMIEEGIEQDSKIELIHDANDHSCECMLQIFDFLAELKLRFLFADDKMTNIYITSNLLMTITELKKQLLSEMPKSMEMACDANRLRFFCLGKELKKSVNYRRKELTLQDLKLPNYSKYPTPIHVAITSANKSKKKTKKNGQINFCCISLIY